MRPLWPHQDGNAVVPIPSLRRFRQCHAVGPRLARALIWNARRSAAPASSRAIAARSRFRFQAKSRCIEPSARPRGDRSCVSATVTEDIPLTAARSDNEQSVRPCCGLLLPPGEAAAAARTSALLARSATNGTRPSGATGKSRSREGAENLFPFGRHPTLRACRRPTVLLCQNASVRGPVPAAARYYRIATGAGALVIELESVELERQESRRPTRPPLPVCPGDAALWRRRGTGQLHR
jgi:hypothetical protein